MGEVYLIQDPYGVTDVPVQKVELDVILVC